MKVVYRTGRRTIAVPDCKVDVRMTGDPEFEAWPIVVPMGKEGRISYWLYLTEREARDMADLLVARANSASRL